MFRYEHQVGSNVIYAYLRSVRNAWCFQHTGDYQTFLTERAQSCLDFSTHRSFLTEGMHATCSILNDIACNIHYVLHEKKPEFSFWLLDRINDLCRPKFDESCPEYVS